MSESDENFPSGCSNERTGGLNKGDKKPDVIIIYLGTNDWAFGAKLAHREYVHTDDADMEAWYDAVGYRAERIISNMEYFNEAYKIMLDKIQVNYPKSEIWCCTILTAHISSNPSFKVNPSYGGTHIEKYNTIIIKSCL